VGRFAPFTEEESALNSYLASRMAGKRLCDYAWRMSAQSLLRGLRRTISLSLSLAAMNR
jgi:hypothetical protein